MPTIPLPKEAALKTVEVIEQCLREGFRPPHVQSGSGSSALQEAAPRLNLPYNTLRSRLAVIKEKSLKDPENYRLPDWSLYKAPDIPAAPAGFKVKGTSTLFDQDGKEILQWVKTTADEQQQMEIFREAIAGLTESIPRRAAIKQTGSLDENLMVGYPVGDHHMGMLSWAPETGANYDIGISERLLSGAMTHLVRTAPKCVRCVIPILGDFLHYDSFVAVTPTNKNPLDADGRFPKMVRAAMRSLRGMVDAALKHHAEVLLIIEIGNHDPASSILLMESLSAFYEKEPRVKVDTSPSHFHYFTFGRCLVGIHHGDGVKPKDLPLVMASDVPDLWGQSAYRYWWTGHVHHDAVHEFAGCRVESFRILATNDAWAASKGYRAGRDMKSIVLHREFGEVARNIVNPAMLEAA